MAEIEVKWTKGYRAKIDADIAFSEFERIRELEGGALDVKIIHDQYAKNKTNPLHSCLEWDNKKAGREWRLEQLRRMVHSIRIIRPDLPSTPLPRYVNVTVPSKKKEEPPRRIYMDIEEALADPVYRDEVLASAIRDALAFRKKYAALSELAAVVSAIDGFLQHAQV